MNTKARSIRKLWRISCRELLESHYLNLGLFVLIFACTPNQPLFHRRKTTMAFNAFELYATFQA